MSCAQRTTCGQGSSRASRRRGVCARASGCRRFRRRACTSQAGRWPWDLGLVQGLVGRLERRAGTLEQALDGRGADLERVTDLRSRKVERLAQQEGASLARRQPLQACGERRARRSRSRSITCRCRIRRRTRRARSGSGSTQAVSSSRTTSSDTSIAAGPRSDGRCRRRRVLLRYALVAIRVEPGADGRLAAEPRVGSPSAQHRLLHEVLRVLHRARESVAVGEQLPAQLLRLPA